jgi:hypothetical protein
MPKGVLANAAALTLTVYEGVRCNESAGDITHPEDRASERTVLEQQLGTAGCPAGAKFCGSVEIPKSETPRIFSAVAKNTAQATLATGCTTASVNQDALPLTIAMVKALATAVCGDGHVQPTEQCEPGGTALCDAQCMTPEVLLSTGSTQNGTVTGGPGDKSNPALLWPALEAAAGRFFAFYTDHAVSVGKSDVAFRAMADDLSPVEATFPALAAGSLFLPNPTFPAPPSPGAQSAPQAAFLNGKYYVVFEDDDTPSPSSQDIHLRSMDGSLVAEQDATPLGINGGKNGSGEPGTQGRPTIKAGPNDALFIAWEDVALGKIFGRTLVPPKTLGAQIEISSGMGNHGVALAPTSQGWIAVWQAADAIKARRISASGIADADATAVQEGAAPAEHPSVASLPDGRYAVVWSAGTDIYVQRYSTTGEKMPGDQAHAINDVVTVGYQKLPVIAGTPAANGSYVVAWEDSSTSHIQARLLGGTEGFRYNHVNGLTTEFRASRDDSRMRTNPAVVVGGDGPFIAIAWEDKSPNGAGIKVRRFPAPEE